MVLGKSDLRSRARSLASRTENRTEALRAAARAIGRIGDRRQQANIAVLAGLVLSQEEIRRWLRSDAMKESAIYQEIKEEGLREGLQQGPEEGRQSTMVEIAAKLLESGMEVALVANIVGLTVEQVQDLRNRE